MITKLSRTRTILIGSLASALLCLPAIPSLEAKMLRLSKPPLVVDSKHKVVGRAISLSPVEAIPYVGLRVHDQILIVGVLRSRFVGTATVLYFTETDCSGTPYFDVGSSSVLSLWNTGELMISPTTVFGPVSTVYIPDPAAPHENIITQSFYSDIDQTCYPVDPVEERESVPAKPIMGLGLKFTPPFHIR